MIVDKHNFSQSIICSLCHVRENRNHYNISVSFVAFIKCATLDFYNGCKAIITFVSQNHVFRLVNGFLPERTAIWCGWKVIWRIVYIKEICHLSTHPINSREAIYISDRFVLRNHKLNLTMDKNSTHLFRYR